MADDAPRILVGPDENSVRLDVFLSRHLPDISRAQLQRLITSGAARVNDGAVKVSYKVQPGDVIRVETPPLESSDISPEPITLDIVYEDSDLLVINKPAGLVVHPAPGSPSGTLVNALLAHCTDLSGIGGVERPGIVHRLDKDTSGLLMVAKNDHAHHSLQRQIQRRTASRRYLAVVWNQPTFENAVIDVPIGRHPTDRTRMAVAAPAGENRGARGPFRTRSAVTEITVRERFLHTALLECSLQTGRTHQIRVHCAFAGFPVIGDPVYGGGERRFPTDNISRQNAARVEAAIRRLHGQALHAFALAFDHPSSGDRLHFEASPPDDISEMIRVLRGLAAG